MQIAIRQTDTQGAPARLFSRKFTVKSRIVLNLENEEPGYSVVEVEPYERDLPAQDTNYGFDDSEPVVYLAEAKGKFAGRIRLTAWWNRFAYVDDLAVNPEFRGGGTGRALLEIGVHWAHENGFPGVMLETQDDNVPACMLYQSCGFTLGGFDRRVYAAFKSERPQTALYWYLLFQNETS